MSLEAHVLSGIANQSLCLQSLLPNEMHACCIGSWILKIYVHSLHEKSCNYLQQSTPSFIVLCWKKSLDKCIGASHSENLSKEYSCSFSCFIFLNRYAWKWNSFGCDQWDSIKGTISKETETQLQIAPGWCGAGLTAEWWHQHKFSYLFHWRETTDWKSWIWLSTGEYIWSWLHWEVCHFMLCCYMSHFT